MNRLARFVSIAAGVGVVAVVGGGCSEPVKPEPMIGTILATASCGDFYWQG